MSEGDVLVLEIAISGFNVNGTLETLDWANQQGDEYTVLDIVTHEWMREDVGLTLVSLPSEKSQNHEFEVHAMDGRIVGARIIAAVSPTGRADG